MHDVEAGCCLGSEGNGVSLGRGVREGPAPLEAGKISSQCPKRQRKHGQGQGRPTKSDVMKEIGVNRVSSLLNKINFCNYDCWVDSDIALSFRRINLVALKKPICIDFLSTCN